MTLTELLDFLKTHGLSPKKGLSQNFLIDQNIIQKIIRVAAVRPGEKILEIGPGPGSLTEALLKEKAHVTAIEKDYALAGLLNRLQTDDRRLLVHCADILDFQIPDHSKIVANLPYNITTPILAKVFEKPFTSLTIMVQWEVAERLLAQPGGKDFSSISLFLQFFGNITDWFKVSASSFYPKPSVDSAVLRIDSKPPPFPEEKPLFRWIRRAFQQRRKMISSSLKDFLTPEQIRTGLEAIQVRPDARPEMLSLQNWIDFYLWGQTISST